MTMIRGGLIDKIIIIINWHHHHNEIEKAKFVPHFDKAVDNQGQSIGEY